MRYEVIWEREALAQEERLAMDDRQGIHQVFTAVDHLTEDSRPKGAFGSDDVLRVRCSRPVRGRSTGCPTPTSGKSHHR